MTFKKSVVVGVKWTSLSHVTSRVLALISNLALARLLAPADFGLMAMAMVIVGFADLFSSLGTSAAVIQQRIVSRELLSSLFWLNLVFGIVATILLYALAPAAAGFYREPRLTPIMQCLAFSLSVGGFRSVQQAIMQRSLAFDTLAKVEIGSSVISLISGIGSAIFGLGVWSLVIQSLSGSIFMTCALWRVSHWKPQFAFQWISVKAIAHYSLNLTAFNVFNYFARNADNFLIGRYLGAQDLGYYDLAYRLLLYPVNAISSVVGRVVFPAYARIQDDDQRIRRAFLQVSASIALVTFPIMLGLAIVSDLFVLTFFSARWVPMIPLILVLAPVGAIQSIITTVGAIYQAKGRTDWLLWWGVTAGVLVVLSFVVGLQWGVVGVAVAYGIASVILAYPAVAIPFRLINLRMGDFARALWRPAAATVVMVAATLGMREILPSGMVPSASLAILSAIGLVAYGFATWFLNRGQLIELAAIFSRKT